MAHRLSVPLQVFSGETTPILGTGPPIITEGLRKRRENNGTKREADIENHGGF